jgi:hypothetical protein
MTASLYPEYFSLLILDPNKLPKNQSVKKIFEQKDMPMYCLFVNANSNDNKIASINNQYHLQWICNGQYCIATLKTTADYYIPTVHIEVLKLIPNIHIYGVLLCIRGTNILYIPFDQCTQEQIDTLLPRLDKFNLKGIKIHIVCVGYNKIRPIKSLETWIYHNLDIKEFCLNYNMNFHIVVNSHYEDSKVLPGNSDIQTQDWSNPDLKKANESNINYGLMIIFPDWIIDYLEVCYKTRISHLYPPA